MRLHAQITLQCFHFRLDSIEPRLGMNTTSLLFLPLFLLFCLRPLLLLLPSCQPSVNFNKAVMLFYARACSHLTLHSMAVRGSDAQSPSVNWQKRTKEKKEKELEGKPFASFPVLACLCADTVHVGFCCVYANVDHLASCNVLSAQAASSP